MNLVLKLERVTADSQSLGRAQGTR